MKINLELKINEFNVPDGIQVMLKDKEGKFYYQDLPLSILDDDTLHQLCENFKREVLKKAGRINENISG